MHYNYPQSSYYSKPFYGSKYNIPMSFRDTSGGTQKTLAAYDKDCVLNDKIKKSMANNKPPYPKREDYSDYSEYTSCEPSAKPEEELIIIPEYMFALPENAVYAFETAATDEDGNMKWKYNNAFHVPGQAVNPIDMAHYLKDMKAQCEAVKTMAGEEFCKAFNEAYEKVWNFLDEWFKDNKLDINFCVAHDYLSQTSTETSVLSSQAE